MLTAIIVVPLAGTWIETPSPECFPTDKLSFPLRERGLKHYFVPAKSSFFNVVPLAGTWIETDPIGETTTVEIVVPLAGTWIETLQQIDRLLQ